MLRSVVSVDVVLPTKASLAHSAAYRSRKPSAELKVELDGGDSRSLYVPVRVARAFQSDQPDYPCDFDSLRDRLSRLEETVAFTVLTEMLSRRDHSSSEVKSKLVRNGFHGSVADRAISRATGLRFLDDERFSRYFIDERLRRGWGRRKIERELYLKGIKVEDIPGYPDEFFTEESDLDRAREVLARRPVPSSRAFEKLVRHLMGKGFSYSVASQAVKERLSSEGDFE